MKAFRNANPRDVKEAVALLSREPNAAIVGGGSDLLGIDRATPVAPFIPVMMFAILFGLSMDYEVFLLSRVREEFLAHGDTARAVTEGLADGARAGADAAVRPRQLVDAAMAGSRHAAAGARGGMSEGAGSVVTINPCPRSPPKPNPTSRRAVAATCCAPSPRPRRR